MSNSAKDLKLESDSKKSVGDPSSLSFFTANDSDSSSDSDSDNERIKEDKITTEFNGDSIKTDNENKLPSPSTLFATVGKPKFLDRPLEDDDIDWQSLSKRCEPLFEQSSVSCETVDLSSAERTEASVSGAPVKYKTEISETKRHLFLHGKRAVDLSNSNVSNDGVLIEPQEDASTPKKQKPS